jgi:hypothetical protein
MKTWIVSITLIFSFLDINPALASGLVTNARHKSKVSKFAEFNHAPTDKKLVVATWNIRQSTYSKINSKINVNGSPQSILSLIEEWLKLRSVDVLALQEFNERTDLVHEVVESPLAGFETTLDSKYDVILGKPIRHQILKGNSSLWKEYCPIIFNKEKLNCYGAEDSIEIGYDQDQKNAAVKTPRFVNWAYCESLDKKFNFVMSCVHTNFKTSEHHVLGLKNVFSKIKSEDIRYPARYQRQNQDFIFAGDFNLDRRTSKVFDSLAKQGVALDSQIPIFPKGTRWKKASFTKLKDIYTFSEARDKATDIYDDVIHTLPMNESLLTKFVDPLVDDFFINKSNKVDMKSLLRLSDHLPVISTYDLTKDTD